MREKRDDRLAVQEPIGAAQGRPVVREKAKEKTSSSRRMRLVEGLRLGAVMTPAGFPLYL